MSLNLLPTTVIALRALAKNKMRASLTVLGIVIGVGAVTTLVSIGQSASKVVQDQLEGLGTNLIIVGSASKEVGGVHGGPGGTPTLTVADAEAIRRECSTSLRAVTPVVGVRGQVIYQNTNWNPQEILGVGEDYLTVRNWEVRMGGFFTDRDFSSGAKVCVVGQTIVGKLFQTSNPIGESIRISVTTEPGRPAISIPFQIIGVLESKGSNILGVDQDDMVLAPYTTVRARLKGSHFDKVDAIFCSAKSDNEERTADATKDIEFLLNERHRIRSGDPADFEVKNVVEIANMAKKVAAMMTALLAAIAGIALLVGGVGIMNIMLVSVTERTREIGVRMAVGARQNDILLQFLNEAILLSTLGGLVGLVLGILASLGIVALANTITPDTPWPIIVSTRAAVVAIIFSVAIGVFFGYYPARRASRMDPIDALRYE